MSNTIQSIEVWSNASVKSLWQHSKALKMHYPLEEKEDCMKNHVKQVITNIKRHLLSTFFTLDKKIDL